MKVFCGTFFRSTWDIKLYKSRKVIGNVCVWAIASFKDREVSITRDSKWIMRLQVNLVPRVSLLPAPKRGAGRRETLGTRLITSQGWVTDVTKLPTSTLSTSLFRVFHLPILQGAAMDRMLHSTVMHNAHHRPPVGEGVTLSILGWWCASWDS